MGPAILVSAVVAMAAVRFAPECAPAAARVYRVAEGAVPATDVASVPAGATQTTSTHHLRIRGPVPAHLHRRHDETVVVLSGRGRLRLGDASFDVGPGTVIQVPRGTVHALEVTESPVEAISVFSPPFDGTDRVRVDE